MVVLLKTYLHQVYEKKSTLTLTCSPSLELSSDFAQ